MDVHVWRDLVRSRAEVAREVSAELCEESTDLIGWAAALRDTAPVRRVAVEWVVNEPGHLTSLAGDCFSAPLRAPSAILSTDSLLQPAGGSFRRGRRRGEQGIGQLWRLPSTEEERTAEL